MPPEPLVAAVSDTARWNAHHRAVESQRPDALFHDPLAARLAGERGRDRAIADTGWSCVARTVLIDELVAKSVAGGCDRVLNLAAGFDTRPYRLALPAGLRWFEADCPDLIAEKEERLAEFTPGCALRRRPVDLADPGAREDFLDEALAGARSALVLAEGLLVHLAEDDVERLAKALHRPPVSWWMFDVAGPAIARRWPRRGTGRRAPVRFAPEHGVAFFERLGWTPVEVCDTFGAAGTLGRLSWFPRLLSSVPQFEPDPRRPGRRRWTAVVRLCR